MPKSGLAQKQIVIDGVSLSLSPAVDQSQEWIGQGDVIRQLLACWLVVHEQDLPLSPRLIGPPGIGKTSSARVVIESCGYTMIELNARYA